MISFVSLIGFLPGSSAQICRASLNPDNANILIAGGGGIALLCAKRLRDMGSWVYMLQRSSVRQAEIEGMMAIMVKGDAIDRQQVNKAFDSMFFVRNLLLNKWMNHFTQWPSNPTGLICFA